MFIIIGVFIVLGLIFGGFMIVGGNLFVFLYVFEFVVILGVGIGVVVIVSFVYVIKEIVYKMKQVMFGKLFGKQEYFDFFKMFYEIFMVGCCNGFIVFEEYVINFFGSSIFVKYFGIIVNEECM